jgi:hypothetical protein
MHTIRARHGTYWTGKTPDGKQVLLGWVWDFVGVLFFDDQGRVAATREFPIGIDPKQGFGPAVEAKVAKLIRFLKRQLHLRKAPIRVEPFSIEKWEIELRLFPNYLEEVLTRPDRFSEEEAEWLRGRMQQWKADRCCVLTWGNDHFINKDGYSF